MNNKLKVLDLFSGIGGFSLGLHSTGIFDTIKFVEFDKYCQKVLNKNFPNIPIEGDIRNVKGTEFEADVITGGFPCQPFSVAGKQKGTNDNRYLWPEMFRLIKEIKPEFVIGENVQGIINLQDGMVLRQVLNDLESEGFEVQCFLIPASGIGAWHQRNRTWIIGHSKHNGLLASEKRSRDKKINGGTSEGQNQTIESERTSRSTNNGNVSNSNSSLRRRWGTIGESGENKIWRFHSEEEEQSEHDIRSQTIRRNVVSRETAVPNTEFERLQRGQRNNKGEGRKILSTEQQDWKEVRSQTGCIDGVQRKNVSDSTIKGLEGCSLQSDNKQTEGSTKHGHTSFSKQQTWWETESIVCGIPNGISYELDKDRANRIKTLGNAIVPQIAREIGLALKKVLIQEGRE